MNHFLSFLITTLLASVSHAAGPQPLATAGSTAPGTRLEAYPGGPVRVVQAFAMGETELSFAQWDTCVNDTSSALRCTYKPEAP